MIAYCLFCETLKCDHVASAVMEKFPCRALSPKQVQHIHVKGGMRDVVHDLLPGYVFLYCEEEELNMAAVPSPGVPSGHGWNMRS